LARLDRKRKKKTSNKDWEHPHDPDARITKMKDGRTHLAHKIEHAADMKTGAILAVTVQGADQGDTTTIKDTMIETAVQMEKLAADPESTLRDDFLSEVVADKGYHSNATMTAFRDLGIRSYISEPDRGARNWKNKAAEQQAVYANRRRTRGDRGKRLLRQRGLMLERPFAHTLETGAMRRVHLRNRQNILKRVLIQYAALNLGLLLRQQFGKGTPRALQGHRTAQLMALILFWRHHEAVHSASERYGDDSNANPSGVSPAKLDSRNAPFTTGC
jgi:transposase